MNKYVHQQFSRRAYFRALSNFRLCPPPPPKKRTWSHVLGSWRRFVFQTETSDSKYVMFSFILDFPFLFVVRISVVVYSHEIHTNTTQWAWKRVAKWKSTQPRIAERDSSPVFPFSPPHPPLCAYATTNMLKFLFRSRCDFSAPTCHPGVHILARDISRSNMAADFCYFAEEIAKIMHLADWNFLFNKSAATW